MSLLMKLRGEAHTLFEKASAITKLETATDEQLTEAKALFAELDTIDERIKSLEMVEKREKFYSQPGTHLPLATGAKVEPGEDRENPKQFANLGEQMIAVKMAAENPGNIDRKLQIVHAMQTKALGLNENVASEGGFLVQQDTNETILRNVIQQSELYERTNKFTVGANSNGMTINAIDETSRATGSRWGGIRGYWLNEGGTKTKSKPKFREITLKLKKLIALMYSTDELLMDAVALTSIATQGVTEEFSFLLDDAVINGGGAGLPLGYLQSAALVSVAKETGQAASTIVFENIVKMWSRMFASSRKNGIWFINQDIEPQLFSMALAVGTGGVPVYMPANGLSDSPFATLMGRPVIPIEQAQTLGTKGDITFADLNQYVSIEKGGMQSASSIHVQFLTDESTFRWTMRADGQPTWAAPLTPFKGTNTLSPFISLDTRA